MCRSELFNVNRTEGLQLAIQSIMQLLFLLVRQIDERAVNVEVLISLKRNLMSEIVITIWNKHVWNVGLADS